VWLVLCASTDTSALWAYQGLRARGLDPLMLVSAEQLVQSLHWEHRLGVEGVTVRITLADGREIRHDRIRGVLNRVMAVPAHYFATASATDRDYATQEIGAFYLSWLYALPGPVLNRPTPQGLCGPWRQTADWHALAGRAGLPVDVYRQTGFDAEVAPFRSTPPDRTIFVVADRVIAPPMTPPALDAGCRRFAELYGAALLGLDFTIAADGRWTLVSCSPMPDLCAGGSALLDALAQHLTQAHQPESKEHAGDLSVRNSDRIAIGAGA
jgi:hypothetical protein